MPVAYTLLKLDVEPDGLATLTLNRPEKRNAIDMELRRELRDAVEQVALDPAIRVLLVTGSRQAFSVGADIAHFEREWQTPAFRATTRILTGAYDALEALEKPVIAVIAGLCVGGGLELALACDLRFAAETARFGLPEGNIGLIPGTGGCSRLVRVVGLGRAKELVLGGEVIGAREARELGLVNRVLAEDELMAGARAFATRLLTRAPQALGMAKRVLNACAAADLQTGRLLESLGQSVLLSTADHREGVRAFREKRPPRFRGE